MIPTYHPGVTETGPEMAPGSFPQLLDFPITMKRVKRRYKVRVRTVIEHTMEIDAATASEAEDMALELRKPPNLSGEAARLAGSVIRQRAYAEWIDRNE